MRRALELKFYWGFRSAGFVLCASSPATADAFEAFIGMFLPVSLTGRQCMQLTERFWVVWVCWMMSNPALQHS